MNQRKTMPQITPHKMESLERLKKRVYQELYREGEVPNKQENEALVSEIADRLGVEEKVVLVAVSFGELPHRYVSSEDGPVAAIPIAAAEEWIGKQLAEAKKESRSFSDHVLDKIPSGVVQAGSDSILDDLNPFSAACQMIGVEEKDLAEAISKGEVQAFEGTKGEIFVSGFEVAEWAGLGKGKYKISVQSNSSLIIEAKSKTLARDILSRINPILPKEMSLQLPVEDGEGKVSFVVKLEGSSNDLVKLAEGE